MSMETDRIEADLRDSRHRLSDTLDALGSKLSPGQMLDEVLGLAQGQAGHLTANLGRQVRDNPLPAVLIVAGAALLFLNKSGRNGDRRVVDDWRNQRHTMLEETRAQTMRFAGETDDAFDDRLHMAYAKALDLKQSAGEAIGDFKRRIGEMVHHAKDSAGAAGARLSNAMSDVSHTLTDKGRDMGRGASHTAHQVQDLYRETPLAAGAIAVAIGAIIGGATPLTNVERDGLGPVADRAARVTGDLAAKGARAVKDGASNPVH